jgi:hypothetical protein
MFQSQACALCVYEVQVMQLISQFFDFLKRLVSSLA